MHNRANPPTDATAHPALLEYRRSIDNIDAALVYMLAERFRITRAVGHYKAQHDLPPFDPTREDRQLARLQRLAEDSQLDPTFTKKFLIFITSEVIRHHEEIQKSEG